MAGIDLRGASTVNAASLPSPRSAWFSLSWSNSSGTLALEWAFGGGDADLLDLTDPTLPTTKVAGLWIVTANPGTPGSSDLNWAVLVELDPDDVDATAIGAPAVYGGRAQASAQAAYGLAVDVAMDVYVSNDTGSSRTFSGYVTLVCVPDPNL